MGLWDFFFNFISLFLIYDFIFNGYKHPLISILNIYPNIWKNIYIPERIPIYLEYLGKPVLLVDMLLSWLQLTH